MSLSRRLVIMVTALVALALIVFVSLMAWRLEVASRHQKQAIEQQMQRKFVEQLQLEGRLAVSFIERVGEGADASIAALAGRNETREQIERGNIVAIDHTMKRAAKSYGLDSILVLDRGLKGLGSHLPGLDLLGANAVFARSELAPIAARLLDQQDRDNPISHRQYLTIDATVSKNMGMGGEERKQERVSSVSIHPVFDEFGDVLALIVGQKVLSENNVALKRFVESLKLGVDVLEGDKVLMNVGLPNNGAGTGLYLSQCSAFEGGRQLCVRTNREQLIAQTLPLTQAMTSERDEVVKWVGGLAVTCLLLAALLASFMTRRVMAPLAQITSAVRSVAGGNWMARVAGKRRKDEVGEIARAVTVLQMSVKEREQLQADVADIDALRESRAALAQAIDACRTALRQRLFSLSDGSERLALSLQRISSLTSLAEGEADETRLVGLRLVEGHVEEGGDSALLRDAIDRMCETLTTISKGSEETTGELDALVDGISALDRTVKGFVTQIDALSEPTMDTKLAA